MLPRPPAPLTVLAESGARLLVFAGLAAVAALTLADLEPGRIYAWPWRLALDVALVAPFPALILRVLAQRKPLLLPARPWSLLVGGASFFLLLSALASPARGASFFAGQFSFSALASFVLLHDWLARNRAGRLLPLLRIAGVFLFLVALASLGDWLAHAAASRRFPSFGAPPNPHPLGSTTTTAALGLLMVSCFVFLAALGRGFGRFAWTIAGGLGLVVLATSAHRVAAIGLGTMLIVALLLGRPGWKQLLVGGLVLVALATSLLFASPRARAALAALRHPAALAPDPAAQTALRQAGFAMGRDHLLLGWGPGTAPLVLPRYRARLAHTPEDGRQFHHLPTQLWAELGAPGLLGAIAFLLLAARAAFRPHAAPTTQAAFTALTGLVAVSFYDSGLDRPILLLAAAILAALIAVDEPAVDDGHAREIAGGLAALGLLAFLGIGRLDPGPRLLLRGLALARDPGQAEAATALLRDSVSRDPNQPIARFNLGWLLVESDPAAAETEFLAAARLAPDERGVYLGLALARLAQQKRDPAIAALVAECLNDPGFLTSPRWRTAPLADLHATVVSRMRRTLAGIIPRLVPASPAAREADYLAALLAWFDGSGQLGHVLAASRTPERVRYFAARPTPPDFSAGRVHTHRRVRADYLAVLRQPDLPAPADVYASEENLPAAELAFLFPTPGWLPAPLLLSSVGATRR